MPIIRAILAAFSMFSRIPVKAPPWDDASRRYMLPALPLVGVAIGAAVYAASHLFALAHIDGMLWGAAALFIPLWLSGGVHMDGFADVCDALGARAGVERSREIMKDPRIGAFGAMGIGLYMLLYFAVSSELGVEYAPYLALSHVLSRIGGAAASLLFPSGKTGGLLDALKSDATKRGSALMLAIWLALWSVAGCFAGLPAAALFAGAIICLAYTYHISSRRFGGMSGDIAGYYIQLSELVELCLLLLVHTVL